MQQLNDIYIYDNNGNRVLFNQAELREQLVVACSFDSSTEDWQIDGFTTAVENHLKLLRDSKDQILSSPDICRLVKKLLFDAGFEVASEKYFELFFVGEELKVSVLTSCSEERVQAILKTLDIFSIYDSNVVGRKVWQAIQQLPFSKISDSLIVEIAKHIIQEWIDESGSELSIEEIVALFDQDMQDLIKNRIVVFGKFTAVTPTINLVINLEELSHYICGKNILELLLIPGLQRVSGVIFSNMANLINLINQRFKHLQLNCDIELIGLDAVTSVKFAQYGDQRNIFQQEISNIFIKSAEGNLDNCQTSWSFS